jgi:hypothetical protein
VHVCVCVCMCVCVCVCVCTRAAEMDGGRHEEQVRECLPPAHFDVCMLLIASDAVTF